MSSHLTGIRYLRDEVLENPRADRLLRSDGGGVDLISDVLPFSLLWYGEPNAVSYAKFRSRSHNAVIRLYDEAGNVPKRTSTRASSKRGERYARV